MNALARVNPAAEGEEVFRVQNFEHQMLAEHCTNGIDVFVTNRRIILLDCQVLGGSFSNNYLVVAVYKQS